MNVRRTLVVLASLDQSPWSASRPDTRTPAVAADAAPPALTNLAHLDWLGDTVDPPDQADHTTYRLAAEPEIGVLWTYAEPRNGVLTRVGGGKLRSRDRHLRARAPSTPTTSRAPRSSTSGTGSRPARPSSRDAAYQMLRGLTYLQTASGENAGNVVLWMQPDGTLNRSAKPVELPDPSDSDASYWVARTIWALGEGYAAFAATDDPADEAFAVFLRERLELSIDAVDRQVLDTYGQLVLGRRQAHTRRGSSLTGPTPALRPCSASRRTSRQVAATQHARRWASSPTASPGSRTGPPAAGPSARCTRGPCRGRCGTAGARRCRRPSPARHRRWAPGPTSPRPSRTPPASCRGCSLRAARTTAGCPRGSTSLRSPTAPTRASSRCWRPPRRSGKVGLRRLAGMQAAWFFGANASGLPAYDPATGRTIDGISGDGGRQHQLGRRVDDPRAAHDARARRQPRRGGGRPGGDHHGAGRDDDAAGGGRQHDRCRTRRHPGGPLDGRVALRRDGLPRPGRRGDRLAARARRRCGPPGDAGGRPGARQHRGHHLVGRRQAARPCRVGRHRSAGCLPGARSAAPRDAAAHAHARRRRCCGWRRPPPAATRPGSTR